MTDQERTTPVCGGCGEVFARAAFGGAGLFLAETLRDAALAAGWQENGEAWTCTVCQAKADAPVPEPEPQPTGAHKPPPDTDPYRQYADMSAELDADVEAFWADENQRHNIARFSIRTRLRDAQVRVDASTGTEAAA